MGEVWVAASVLSLATVMASGQAAHAVESPVCDPASGSSPASPRSLLELESAPGVLAAPEDLRQWAADPSEGFPNAATAHVFLDLLVERNPNPDQFKDSAVAEQFLFRLRPLLEEYSRNGQKLMKGFPGGASLFMDGKDRVLIYQSARGERIELKDEGDKVRWEVPDTKDISRTALAGEVQKRDLSESYEVRTRLQMRVLTLAQTGRGMTPNPRTEGWVNLDYAFQKDEQKRFEQEVGAPVESRIARVKQAIYHPADGENTKWKYVPLHLIYYPATKIQYDIPNTLTSLVTESVVRSPIHNALGTIDDSKGAVKTAVNGLKDIGRGILNPRNAAAVDGALELVDSGVKLVRAGTGVVKTAVSIVGYPIYRLFGGKKSKRVAVRGKRAAIVLIDSELGGLPGKAIDEYGAEIVRYQLKGVTDYVCVASSSQGDQDECIRKIPKNIEYVDFLALTHTGGQSEIQQLADRVARSGAAKPDLMLSIACFDPPSSRAERENSMGQVNISWAVHFYLANLLAKRDRGIPVDQAAMQAYREGFVSNILNPISIGGDIATRMEGGVGYKGSKPRFIGDGNVGEAELDELDDESKGSKPDPAPVSRQPAAPQAPAKP